MHFNPSTSRTETSFIANRAFILSTKLLLDELPLLATLQKRKPEVYNPEWNCILCNTGKETWSHLWICSAIAPLFAEIRDEIQSLTIQKLSTHERAPTAGLSARLISSITNLHCWLLPQENDSSQLGFDYFIRGLIPHSLSDIIQSVVGTRDNTYKLIADIVTESHKHFKELIWKPRCEVMIAFEKDHHITTQAKKSVSTASSSGLLP